MFEGLFQPMHLIIILAIVLIVFGPGKVPDIGGALGRGIKEFKTSVNEEAAAPTPPAPPVQAAQPAAPVQAAPVAQVTEAPKQP